MLPKFVVELALFLFETLQFTGTSAPVDEAALHDIWLPDETVVASTRFLSMHVTLAMAVGCNRVKFCVAVKVDCTCEVAVIVTELYCWVDPGIAAGAVYNPPAVIEP